MYVCYYNNKEKLVKFEGELDFWCWMDDHHLIGNTDEVRALYYDHDVSYGDITSDILYNWVGDPCDDFFGYDEMYDGVNKDYQALISKGLLEHLVPDHIDWDGNLVLRAPNN